MTIDKEYIKMTYYTTGSSSYPETKTEITLDVQSTLPEVIERFEDFLKACGYVFKGKLEIIEEEYD